MIQQIEYTWTLILNLDHYHLRSRYISKYTPLDQCFACTMTFALDLEGQGHILYERYHVFYINLLIKIIMMQMSALCNSLSFTMLTAICPRYKEKFRIVQTSDNDVLRWFGMLNYLTGRYFATCIFLFHLFYILLF